MATHSSTLAWRIPGTGEPGGLPPMGSHRVGHDWSDLGAAAAAASSRAMGNISLLVLKICIECLISQALLLFSHSVVSEFLLLNGLQHTRLPCPSLSPRYCSNSCPLSWWCHSTISSSVTPFSSYPQSFPTSGSFPNESALHLRWLKYWSFSFSISSSNEHSGLISFRIDPFHLLAV